MADYLEIDVSLEEEASLFPEDVKTRDISSLPEDLKNEILSDDLATSSDESSDEEEGEIDLYEDISSEESTPSIPDDEYSIAVQPVSEPQPKKPSTLSTIIQMGRENVKGKFNGLEMPEVFDSMVYNTAPVPYYVESKKINHKNSVFFSYTVFAGCPEIEKMEDMALFFRPEYFKTLVALGGKYIIYTDAQEFHKAALLCLQYLTTVKPDDITENICPDEGTLAAAGRTNIPYTQWYYEQQQYEQQQAAAAYHQSWYPSQQTMPEEPRRGRRRSQVPYNRCTQDRQSRRAGRRYNEPVKSYRQRSGDVDGQRRRRSGESRVHRSTRHQ